MREQTEDRRIGVGNAARMVGVHPNTIRNWASSGRIGSFKTPGGHRRYSEREMIKIRNGERDNG